MFFNDFEAGEVFGGDAPTQFFHRAGYSNASNYAVLDGALMGGRAGKVLRGNMWQWIDGDQDKGQAYDPLAKAQGIEIKGTKTPAISVALDELGIVQVPPADAAAQTEERAEVYISLWFWMDADFTYKALSNGALQEQSVKLFYAFGTNDTQWVQTTQNGYNTFFLNVNELGGWFKEDGSQSGPKLEGAWHHLEFAFRSESKPVYYEYGSFSKNPGLLASGCEGVKDYTIAFPVVGSSPQVCLSKSEALAQNSQDGRYQMRVDGQTVIDLKQVPFNARFSGFNFPAWHGGGGQAVGSAGWAMDDYCVRDRIPEGMLD